MLEKIAGRPQKKIKKLKSAASTDVIWSRIVFNTNTTRQVRNLFKGLIKKTKKGSKNNQGGPDGNQTRVFTRTFVNSNNKITRRVKASKKVTKQIKQISVKAMKKTDIGGSDGYSVRCKNRFEVLTHLQENWDVIDGDKGEFKEYGQSTLVASNDSNTVKGKKLDNETQNSRVVIEREKMNMTMISLTKMT